VPRREHSTGRRAPFRRSRPLVLVVCGAERTEAAYFTGLRDSTDNRAVDVRIIRKPRAPAQVVRHAVRYAGQARADFDEIWCVFDVDEFDIIEAVRLATENRIELAVSHPCFELWLLLHHDECNAHVQGHDAVVVRLKKYVPAYDKADLTFADYAAGLPKAIERANRLEPTGSEYSKNPSTSVWRLVERMLEQ
jgi:RloB-like protein